MVSNMPLGLEIDNTRASSAKQRMLWYTSINSPSWVSVAFWVQQQKKINLLNDLYRKPKV